MTKQEQLAALIWASEELDSYVSNLAYAGVLTEDEAKDFDDILEKINKVAEAIRHEATPPPMSMPFGKIGTEASDTAKPSKVRRNN